MSVQNEIEQLKHELNRAHKALARLSMLLMETNANLTTAIETKKYVENRSRKELYNHSITTAAAIAEIYELYEEHVSTKPPYCKWCGPANKARMFDVVECPSRSCCHTAIRYYLERIVRGSVV